MSYTPKPGSKTARAIDYIRQHGAARTSAIGKHIGEPAATVSALLHHPVEVGYLISCKIKLPGVKSENEYRLSSGATRAPFRELSGAPRLPIFTTRPTDQQRRAPQPAVGQNTGSASPVSLPSFASTGERAVAEKAPASKTKGRGIGPAASSVSACDVMPISINDAGGVSFELAGDLISLSPADTRALGSFLARTQGVWEAA